MCGVIGYQSDHPNQRHGAIVRTMFQHSKVRGLHAFGFSYSRGQEVKTFKTLRIANLYAALLFLASDFPAAMIGHNRYCTSGDWQETENNQPVSLPEMTLAYNGVIDMRAREEYAADYGRDYLTANDGEIFMRHVIEGGDPVAFVRQHGSFAGCYLYRGEVYALRNRFRPLWYVMPDEHTTLIGSTQDIFKRALQEFEPVELPDYELFTLNQIRDERPRAKRSQQAGRLHQVPLGYEQHWRYRPRLSGHAVSGRSL